MGAYPRYCVQCGSGLNPGIRFCGNCGHAAAPADAEAAVASQHDAPPPGIDVPARGGGAGDRPGLPPLRSPSQWEDPPFPAAPSASGEAGYAAPSRDTGYPAPASSSAPPGFSAPPTGPAYPPPPAPSPPPASPRPPSPGDGTAQFGTSWMDEVGFNPRWEQAPPALPPSTDARPGDGRQRPRGPLTIGLFVLVAAVLVVPALLIVHAFHGLGGGSRAAAAQPASKRPTQSTSTAPTERAAASALASLLAQSVTDRDTIVSAVGAVNHCTSGLGQAPHAFRDAATSRQRLLQQLARMAGRSALPAAMLRELTGAWQASAAVDADLGKWAQDEVSRGCTKNDHGDANFQASNTPDVQATNDKTAFIGRWNPIAAKYGLTRYSTSQL